MRVAVVVPALNEERTIAAVLERVLAADLSSLGVGKEIIVVDDGSSDATGAIVRERFPSVILLRHDAPRGKGAAVRTAMEHSRAEYVIIQDADLEYDPADYPRLIEPIARGVATVVYGSRFLAKTYPLRMLGLNYIGNIIGTRLANVLFGAALTDLMTGYKVMPLSLLRALDIKACGFDICPEVTAKLLKRKVVIYEVPIAYRGRSRAEGKKIRFFDGILIARSLVREKFRKEGVTSCAG